jgi:hypothetical protein
LQTYDSHIFAKHYEQHFPAPVRQDFRPRCKCQICAYRTAALCGPGSRPSHSTPHFQSIYAIRGPLQAISTNI